MLALGGSTPRALQHKGSELARGVREGASDPQSLRLATRQRDMAAAHRASVVQSGCLQEGVSAEHRRQLQGPAPRKGCELHQHPLRSTSLQHSFWRSSWVKVQALEGVWVAL